MHIFKQQVSHIAFFRPCTVSLKSNEDGIKKSMCLRGTSPALVW